MKLSRKVEVGTLLALFLAVFVIGYFHKPRYPDWAFRE